MYDSLFIFYKNVIFWPKPSKEIEIATNKITNVLNFGVISSLDVLIN